MQEIKGYIFCVLMASVASGILKNLSSGMKRFERHIGFVCSLTVIVIIAVPLVEMISDAKRTDNMLPDISYEEENYKSDSEEIIARQYVTEAEKTIEQMISQRFDINRDLFYVQANINDTFEIDGVTVFLYTDIDTEEIKLYCKEMLGINTEIRRIDTNEK